MTGELALVALTVLVAIVFIANLLLLAAFYVMDKADD